MKSILVELDEQTSNLMKSVNSDLTSEISVRVDSSIEKISTSLQQFIEEEVGRFSSTTDHTLSGIKRELEDLADSLEELSDDLNGLDQIADLESVVNNLKESTSILSSFATVEENHHKETIDTLSALRDEIGSMYSALRERLQQSDDFISTKIFETENTSRSEILKCQQQINLQAENLLNRVSEIRKETDENLTQSKEYISNKIESIKKDIAVSIEHINSKINETQANIDAAERNVQSRIDSFDTNVENIDRKISALNTAIDQQSKTVLSELGEVKSVIAQAMQHLDLNASQAEKNHNTILNILNNIVNLTTPFWKRKKNKNGKED